tara:strand:- start:2147 stop:2464 length:318 start_codon:yes stop_codon:yes gene_type:complete
MAFPLVIWDRARLLLMGGYRQDEVSSNLAVEFSDVLDEFQLEDLPIMVRSVHRQLEMLKSKNVTPIKRRVYGEQRANIKQQGAFITPEKPKQSNDDSTEKSGTFG